MSAPNWPKTPDQWRQLKRSLAYSGGKAYGGTRGDSAFINWMLSIFEIGAAITVAVFCFRFLSKMDDYNGENGRTYKTVYYCGQFVLGLSILTASILTLYVLWVFADKRHPMRKAWLTMAEAGALEPTQPGGKIPPFPGLGTMKAPHANRMTIDRVFAERRHISKMVGLYGFLFVAWFIAFAILSFADGYITWTKRRENSDIKIAQICGNVRNNEICWDLARTGISTGAIAALFLLNVIASTVALIARPMGSTTLGPGT